CLKIQKRQLTRNELVALNFIILGISLCIEKLQSMAGNSSSYVGNHYFILACSVFAKENGVYNLA
ncbi:hypothetical protein, partial [Bacteroides xylanisolvens]